MKDLNLGSLLGIFEKDDLEIYEDHEVVSTFFNERVIFGTVVRSIENFYLLDETSQRGSFRDRYEVIRDQVQLKYFNKYFYLLNTIDSLSLDTIDPTVRDLGVERVRNNLTSFLNFFITAEDYLKCSKIKEFLSFIDKFY